MKNSKILGFIAIMIILVAGIGLFAADLDFSDLYLGTAYKRLLVLRNDTALTGLPATTPDAVYDGEFTAAPFSLSQEEMIINSTLQLQFNNADNFIQGAATSLLIDGNTDLQLTGTAITMSGIVSCGNFITTGGGTSAIASVPISGSTGSFTSLAASTTLGITGLSTLAAVTAVGAVDFNSTTFDIDATDDIDIDTNDTTGGIAIGTVTSGVPISIGHGTSETTINDNLTVTGTLTQTGIITATGGIDGTVGAVTPTTGIFTDVTSTGTGTFATVKVTATTTIEDFLILSSTDIQMNSGNGIFFDADDNSGIQSDAGDEITFFIGGTAELVLTSSVLKPFADGGLSLGITGTYEFADIFTQDLHISDDLSVADASTMTGTTTLNGDLKAAATAEFNTGQADIDFTIKSDDNAIAFVVDASEDNIEFGAAISYNAPQTFADVDASPSVKGYSFFYSGGAAETITTFDDPNAQQYIIIYSKAAITFDYDADNLKCGSADLVTAAGDVTHWMYIGTDWVVQTFIDISADLTAW